VVAAAPRLDLRLRDELESLAQGPATAAEIRRALAVTALAIGVPPPSYEHVRRLVLESRMASEEQPDSEILPLIVDVALGIEHGNELMRVTRGGKRHRR
jgi:hypothetical protein